MPRRYAYDALSDEKWRKLCQASSLYSHRQKVLIAPYKNKVDNCALVGLLRQGGETRCLQVGRVMDRRWLAGLAALLLLCSLTGCLAQETGSVDVSDDEEAEEVGLANQGAFLIARKYLPGKDMVKGRSVVVTVELHNVGSR